jgi:hypothetical protein
MTLALLEMPDDSAQLAIWLERRLVSLHLHDLVVELEVIQKSGQAVQHLDDVCGAALPQILQEGLRDVSVATLRNLFRCPRVLIELQERILSDGGDYWTKVAITAEHQAAVDRGKRELRDFLKRDETPPAISPSEMQPSPNQATSVPMKSPPTGHDYRSAHRRIRRWIAISVTASLLLVMGLFLNQVQHLQTSLRPKKRDPAVVTMVGKLSVADYLNRLADDAEKRFKQPAESREALERRLVEYRAYCEALSTADQLDEENREWLRTRSRDWTAKLDQDLADLKSGTDQALVEKSVGATVETVVQELRERSARAASSGRKNPSGPIPAQQDPSRRDF